jgi:type II secretory pathway pseudopilin PulG
MSKNKYKGIGYRVEGLGNASNSRVFLTTPYTLNPNSSAGFTLIEVVIYLAIFSMIVVTLVSLAYVSARENQGTINNVINAYENK